MTNHKYFIRITPLGAFFFGGEKTFSTPSGDTNYFARSNFWPQQTTILGALRYLLGKKHDFDTAKIGTHSFIAGNTDDFGLISKLSPVFIVSKDENNKNIFWLEAGIDHQNDKKSKKLKRISLREFIPVNNEEKNFFEVYSTKISSQISIPNLDFEYKEYLIPVLYNHKNKADLNDIHNFCKEQFQVGNKKNYTGGADDDAFFKQVFFKLVEGFSFGVFLETTEELGFEKEIAAMGADQSLFSLEFENVTANGDTVFEKIGSENSNKTGQRTVLLSDAYVEPKILEKCTFAIADTVDFRNIITYEIDMDGHEKTTDHYRMDFKNSKKNAARKSVKYNLLKRGSVIYNAAPNDIEALLNNVSFNNIGYNYYEITN